MSEKMEGDTDDDDGCKKEKGEAYFADSGSIVVALKDMPPHVSERRLSSDSIRSTNSNQSNNSDIQQHLQSMLDLLLYTDTLKMAVKLESSRPNRTRYLVIASRCCCRGHSTTERKTKITRNNSAKVTSTSATLAIVPSNATAAVVTVRQMSVDSGSHRLLQQQLQEASEHEVQSSSIHEKRISSNTSSNRHSIKCDADKSSGSGDGKCAEGIEESCLLGIDCNERSTIGLVVPILADTTIHLDGDGGFSVAVYGKTHIFKPVSVQAMWSALQTLHKVSQKARENNFYHGGPSHDWIFHYESSVGSDQSCLNEWNTMDSIESRRPPSPDAIRNKPTAKEETESVIKMKLKEIMMSVDLDEVTSKYIRSRLEEHLDMDLGEYKSFIDEEMLMILGQMDAPTEIFEHVYLGSEWNASNLEELLKNGVRHILNVTREIDNFFPGTFDYFNVRVYDDDKTDLLKHWDNTYRYITQAKKDGSKVLVHCKMGVSRSASVVIAYAMKAYNWDFDRALEHVKNLRNCIKPNKNFLTQLVTYRGMLDAMKNKEKLQRSKSETNLKSSTKDARDLPGSEPTPLIQALNQTSKSKSTGHGVSESGVDIAASRTRITSAVDKEVTAITMVNTRSVSDASNHRRLLRRSSSTSPKCLQKTIAAIDSSTTTLTSTIAVTVIRKQQSQSMENLTPERSVADEPKNVRFPGSNGENYSVTQNQVLHIQKNTPPPPPPPPPPAVVPSTTINSSQSMSIPSAAAIFAASTASPTSVRNRIHDLEEGKRKTPEDRKTLNLHFNRSVSHETTGSLTANNAVDETRTEELPSPGAGSIKSLGSPVWTSSAKLITQTSHINQPQPTSGTSSLRSSLRSRRDTNESVKSDTHSECSSEDMIKSQPFQHSRKTQSWAASSNVSGGITIDLESLKLGSNISIDSVPTASNVHEGSFVRTRTRPRDHPSRHASWGSGDTRCTIMRNSSLNAYDANRNTFQFGSGTTSAIFEGQIHDAHSSHHTAGLEDDNKTSNTHHGTVKRTKQKLEESSSMKKMCQENGGGSSLEHHPPQKRISNLYRSASAAAGSRFPLRCNSDEIVATSKASVTSLRRSDGSRPLNAAELISSADSSVYTSSDIENKNTPHSATDDDKEEAAALAAVVLRDPSEAAEQKRISAGSVQILKKNFEAKAGAGAITVSGTSQSSSSSVGSTKKNHHHQSLPSSPVAQHVHSQQQTLSGNPYFEESKAIKSQQKLPSSALCSSTASSANSSTSSSSSANETNERNNKGLVEGLKHKYQATTTNLVVTSLTNSVGSPPYHTAFSKQRPRSYYENPHNIKSLTGRTHDYSESRPPPAPNKTAIAITSTTATTETILAQHAAPQRRQHGNTHPLARLPLQKQNLNAAAYNTM